MITTTLDAMAAGGIHDQLGGGFARYSTDDDWLVPHFEKMLYDNALLTRAYLHGYLVTGEPRYRARRRRHRRLRAARPAPIPAAASSPPRTPTPRASKASSTCWSLDEIREVCGDDADEVDRATTASPTPGTSSTRTPDFRGNILHVVDRNEPAPPAVAARPRQRCSNAARTRVRPGLDDKVLLGWNALFLAALTEAAAALDRDDWMDAARANARFLLARAARAPTAASGGRGGRRTSRTPRTTPRCSKRSCTLAELDDVAWLADARAVADELLRLFHDADGGGFFTTGHDAEAARRAAQGPVRRRDAVGQLARRQRPAAPRRAHRRRRATRSPRSRSSRCSPARWRRTRPASRTCSARSSGTCAPPIEIVIVGDPADAAHARAARARSRAGSFPASVTLAARRRRPRDPAARRSRRRATCRPRTCASTTRAAQPVTDTRRAPRAARRRARGARRAEASAGGDVGAGGELLGDGPTERDHRLAACRRRARRRATRSWRRRWPSPGWRRGPARTAACGPSPRP